MTRGIMCRMDDQNLNETQPNRASSPPSGGETRPIHKMDGIDQPKAALSAPDAEKLPGFAPSSPRKSIWRFWPLFGILGLLLVAAASGLLGYNSGISQRRDAEATQVASRAAEQFRLGVEDLDAKRFDRARQRFEYVIQLDPAYPDVTEKLAEALLYLHSTATPTIAPTPTLSPTADNRSVEEKFIQAQQNLANREWNAAIDALLSLRKEDPDYQPVWVDDMLYISFRNRGSEKILREGDLEGGIYDLTTAEQFGMLDADAKGYLVWARIYITGASFWELDWGQAVYYFAQVAPALPNLRDGSGWTATERYRIALIGYGKYLADQKEWCDAVEQFKLSLKIGPDKEAEDEMEEASTHCKPKNKRSTEPPSSELEATPTITPSDEGSEATATPEPTQPPATEPPPPTEPTPTPGS